MENAITRDQALETLYALINSGILSEDMENAIQEIANNVENEKYGLHLWGADNDDYAFLVTAVRDDLRDEAYMEKGQRIWDKYAFAPSPFEEKEIDEAIEADEE